MSSEFDRCVISWVQISRNLGKNYNLINYTLIIERCIRTWTLTSVVIIVITFQPFYPPIFIMFLSLSITFCEFQIERFFFFLQTARVNCSHSANQTEMNVWLINFNWISTHLAVFYAKELGNHIHCSSIFTFFV